MNASERDGDDDGDHALPPYFSQVHERERHGARHDPPGTLSSEGHTVSTVFDNNYPVPEKSL